MFGQLCTSIQKKCVINNNLTKTCRLTSKNVRKGTSNKTSVRVSVNGLRVSVESQVT
jgi:hypothetical protein